MALATGRRLGPYEIAAPIGAGGMGEVYKAKDTRLDRTVALKVLPEHVAGDPKLKQRFDREAKVVSSLNHPHICTLHDVGTQDGIDFLVLEYLEGETLAQRVAKGALPLEQALQYANQIADALAKAHRQGIVHRDLKPGNIMLTKSGAKLLDFGLAKPYVVTTNSGMGVSTAPTVSSPITSTGSIVGTFQYMAPEQLEGHEADARTDIFAFGAVLYEMVTGQRAFEGQTRASLIAAILERQPRPLSELQPLTPPALDQVIRGCLAKSPDDRWQTIHDVMKPLSWVAAGISEARATVRTPHTRGHKVATWLAAAVAVVLAAAAGWFARAVSSRAAGQPQLTRFQIETGIPPQASEGESLAISPDGRTVAFVAQQSSGVSAVFTRALDSVEALPLAGTEGARAVVWSPDGHRLAFIAGGQLKTIEAGGGAPLTLCDARSNTGLSWGANGSILFADSKGLLFRVPASPGKSIPVSVLDPARDGSIPMWPSFLPDGRHFLFSAADLNRREATIYVGSIDSMDRVEVLKADAANSVYAASGYLLFVRNGALLAQRFDAQRFAVAGEPIRVVDRVSKTFGGAAYAISPNGVLAYRRGNASAPTQLTWYDRSGRALSTIGAPNAYRGIAISPDGKRIAAHVHQEPNGGDIWMLDADRGTSTRLTISTAENNSPVWSPDGRTLAFNRGGGFIYSLFRQPTNGIGDAEQILNTPEHKWLGDWSRDGRALSYSTSGGGFYDIWILPLGSGGRPAPFATTEATELDAKFSPDGHWIAYTSSESGQEEIYVQSYPSGKGKWHISSQSGHFARWAHSGKELFYLSDDGGLMAVDVQTDKETFKAGPPRRLFKTNILFFDDGGFTSLDYDISPDDQRFLINELPAKDANPPITVVMNWTAALRK